jgi:hypothetical protein
MKWNILVVGSLVGFFGSLSRQIPVYFHVNAIRKNGKE